MLASDDDVRKLRVANSANGNNGRIVARGARQGTAVADLLLDVADDSTLRQLRDREDVANRKLGLLAAVDEGTSVEALGGDESLLAELVPVGVAEDDASKGSTTKVSGTCRFRFLRFVKSQARYKRTGQHRG